MNYLGLDLIMLATFTIGNIEMKWYRGKAGCRQIRIYVIWFIGRSSSLIRSLGVGLFLVFIILQLEFSLKSVIF